MSKRLKAYAPVLLSAVLAAGTLAVAVPSTRPAVAAAAPNWQVDKAASSILVDGEITESGTAFTGTFRDWTANIAFDPQDLAASHVEVKVTMLSFEADAAEATEFFPEPDWAFPADFPTATFATTAIRDLGGGKYEAAGNLKIKGIEKPIVLPFTLAITGDTAKMSGEVTLDRTAFNLGAGKYAGEDYVAKKAVVKIAVSAKRA